MPSPPQIKSRLQVGSGPSGLEQSFATESISGLQKTKRSSTHGILLFFYNYLTMFTSKSYFINLYEPVYFIVSGNLASKSKISDKLPQTIINRQEENLTDSSSDEETNPLTLVKTEKRNKTGTDLPEKQNEMFINCPVQNSMETHSQNSSEGEEEEPPAKTIKRNKDNSNKKGRN